MSQEFTTGAPPAGGAVPSFRDLASNGREAHREVRYVLRKHGRALAPPLVEKLSQLSVRLELALASKNAGALVEAYRDAADCLENEAAPFRKGIVREYVEVIALALALALFSRAFVIQAFKIPSGSMIPTLLIGDYLLVSKLSYGVKSPAGGWVAQWAQPKRGDVIVFITPEDKSLGYFDQRDFIKRVIATGGESVEVRDRAIFVNGEAVEDPWGYYETGPALDRANYGPVRVPDGHFFVMGDNRNDSMDSRVWGFVPMEMVVGKAVVIYYSFGDHVFLPRLERLGRVIH